MHQQADKSSQSQLSQIEAVSLQNLALFAHYYQISKLHKSLSLSIFDKNTNEYETPNYYRHKKRKRVPDAKEMPIIGQLVSNIFDENEAKVTKVKVEVDMKKTAVAPQPKSTSVKEDLQSGEEKSQMSEAGKSTKTKKGRPKMQVSRLKIKVNNEDPAPLTEDPSPQALNAVKQPIEIHSKEVLQVKITSEQSNPLFWNDFKKKENVDISGNLQQFLIPPNQPDSPSFSQASDLNFFSKNQSRSNLSSHSKKVKVQGSKKKLQEHPSSQKSNDKVTPKKEYLPRTADKVIESRLIVENYDRSKSKSKNKSQSKIVKESTILIKTNRIGSFVAKKSEGYCKKVAPSPEPLLQPVTHKPKVVSKESQAVKKIKVKQEDRLPIEDCEADLYQNQSEDMVEGNSLDLEEFGLNQNNGSLSQRVYNKTYTSGLQTSKKAALDQIKPSQYKEKPIEKPKDQAKNTIKYSTPSKQRLPNEEQIINKPSIHIVELQEKDESQKSIKTPRKKIFSHTNDKVSNPSTHKQLFNGQQFNEEEIRMILGAKGNKYKQAIVMQYIRIGRATKPQE